MLCMPVVIPLVKVLYLLACKSHLLSETRTVTYT